MFGQTLSHGDVIKSLKRVNIDLWYFCLIKSVSNIVKYYQFLTGIAINSRLQYTVP